MYLEMRASLTHTEKILQMVGASEIRVKRLVPSGSFQSFQASVNVCKHNEGERLMLKELSLYRVNPQHPNTVRRLKYTDSYVLNPSCITASVPLRNLKIVKLIVE